MKIIIVNKISFLIVSIFLINPLLAAKLEVSVKDLKDNTGQVLVYLHNKAESFPIKGEKAIASKFIKIQNKTAKAVFNNITPGVYAISVIHDINSNGKIDRNFIGLPKEGFGFSGKSTKRHFGPPSFEKSSFKFNNENIALQIMMRYSL